MSLRMWDSSNGMNQADVLTVGSLASLAPIQSVLLPCSSVPVKCLFCGNRCCYNPDTTNAQSFKKVTGFFLPRLLFFFFLPNIFTVRGSKEKPVYGNEAVQSSFLHHSLT